MKKSTEVLFDKYRARHTFASSLEPELRQAVELLEDSFRRGGKLLVCGNGGSNADADHIVGELVKSFRLHRPLSEALKNALPSAELAEKLQGGLPAIDLGAHTSLLTAMVNDVGGEYIFAQQVVSYGRPEDVLLGISTSGNSKNVLYAGEVARAMGMKTIGLTGRDGGRMKDAFDLTLIAPAAATEDIQDIHSTLYHILCAALECQFWGD